MSGRVAIAAYMMVPMTSGKGLWPYTVWSDGQSSLEGSEPGGHWRLKRLRVLEMKTWDSEMVRASRSRIILMPKSHCSRLAQVSKSEQHVKTLDVFINGVSRTASKDAIVDGDN